MENTTNTNIPNSSTNSTEPVKAQAPNSINTRGTDAVPTAPSTPNDPKPVQPSKTVNKPDTQQAFYNNYPRQQGTIAYNVPTYTPGAQQNPVYRSAPTQNNQSPSAIYNNTRTGNAPQYHYGNPTATGIINNAYLDERQLLKKQNKQDSKTLRTFGNFAGLAIIILLIAQFPLSFPISFVAMFFPGMEASFAFNIFFNSVYQVFVIGLTFLALFFIQKKFKDPVTKIPKYEPSIKLNAAKKPLKAILLIFVSFGGCMVANVVVSLISEFFYSFGIESGYDSLMSDPTNVPDIVLMFLGVAIIPPLIEEFSMRGVLLSSMQKYGNRFSMIATAFVFGLFHGNFTQIPFAFICGLFFAYMTIATNSLWPAIIVHAMNNSLSCILTTVELYVDYDTAEDVYLGITIAGIALGFISLIIYLILYRKEFILKAPSKIPNFSTAKKFRKFMSSPGMIFATIIYTGLAILTALLPKLMELLEELQSATSMLG